ncbi:hypothetical protein [Pseudomonas marginalis]|uniref:hypothetical protein n=1 Tax=Pseudomonas marginalis TaxID=298 RepID=UPI003B9E0F39
MNLLLRDLGNDLVHIEHNGKRNGPYRCNFSTTPLRLFNGELEITEGDKIIRKVHGQEFVYTIIEFDYYAGGHSHARFDPHYELTITKDSALPKAPPTTTTTNNINISASTGIQIGDNNVQNLEVALKEVLASIDKADAPKEDREEAKNRLNAFLAHPLVSAAVGGALPVTLGLLS